MKNVLMMIAKTNAKTNKTMVSNHSGNCFLDLVFTGSDSLTR